MALDPAFKQRMDTLLADNKVVLFMKGNRRMPQCGFSQRVVGILDGIIDDYTTVDVLSDSEVRMGMKEYSDWPTFPQLYVDNELVGGCDIITEMAGSGELHATFGVELEHVETPEVTITDAAAAELSTALTSLADGEFLRLKIPGNFRFELNLGPKTFGDIEVTSNGYTLLMDRASAKIGCGTVVDFVRDGMQAGFKISNPNEPASVKQITPAELKALMEGGDTFRLLDVRTPEEMQTASITGASPLDEQELASLDRGITLVFHCHHGMRSQEAAEHFRSQGFRDVRNLAGGIDAWSKQVDSSVPTY
jgi:monothiol glutaredoxin